MNFTAPTYELYNSIFKEVPAPFAYIDLDFLDQNIKDIKQRCLGKKVRIASKSIRCLSVLQRIMESELNTNGIMTYSPYDTVYLAQKGFSNLLIGYPISNPTFLSAIAKEIKKGCQITLMCDLEEHLAAADKAAKEYGITIPICIDLDMSNHFPGIYFGVFRSSINSQKKAVAFYKKIKKHENIRLVGLMGYEAQIAGIPDRAPSGKLKSVVIRALKKKAKTLIAIHRAEVVNALINEGATLEFVNAGGTGSLESSGMEELVTEVTVGSGFFSPTTFDHFSNFKHLPAAGFALEIVRKPAKNTYTCFGGGYIASGPIGLEKQPQPYLPADISIIKNEGFGEVQTPVKSKESLSIGDPIFFRHAKAGELCEHFDSIYLIKKQEILQKATTYRGDRLLSIFDQHHEKTTISTTVLTQDL
ncbi:alanine racemase [Flammeovirgaceae bacterium SG7u.111]|nr:alanine racemase [Flammeovirgaceae bacterium SG7u.132]WPO38288.1 alanine racemase [Flammeovirgaceae bacterium SG7u.111]